MRRRCSLCGGKLVKNRCVECGLDNSKSDAAYRVNESRCDQGPLTHVHHEKKNSEENPIGKRQTKQIAERIQKQYQKKEQRHGDILGSEKKRGLYIVVVIGILILVMNGFRQISHKIQENRWENEFHSEYDPYEYLEKALKETGDHFEGTYTGGEYIVGVHIPEGQYRVELLEGSGSVSLEDNENNIYFSKYFSDGDENSVTEIEDFRLFTGARVNIYTQLKVRLVSENAQVTDMQQGIANPLTEKVELQGEMVAGRDFKAGVYDVTFRLPDGEKYGMGYMKYIVPGTVSKEDVEEYEASTGRVMLGEEEEVYHNLVLPEGTVLKVEEGIILLSPSEMIGSEDYAAYYENQYIE